MSLWKVSSTWWLLQYLYCKEKSSFCTNCCFSFCAGSRMPVPVDVFSPRDNPRWLEVSRTSFSNKWGNMSSWYYWQEIFRSKDGPQAYLALNPSSREVDTVMPPWGGTFGKQAMVHGELEGHGLKSHHMVPLAEKTEAYLCLIWRRWGGHSPSM